MTADEDRFREESSRIERVIEERAAARARLWFPDLEEVPSVQLRPLSTRPRCSLYVVRVAGGGSTHTVLAKVRRGDPDAVDAPRREGRPRLRTDSSTIAELSELEYEGLRSIYRAVAPPHSLFGAVRPLDHLAVESMILQEYVDADTLRNRFIAESRMMVHQRLTRRPGLSGTAWHNAGAWLRTYHDSPPVGPLPSRQATRADVVDRFHAYGAFLTGRVGARVVGAVAATGAELAARLLPERLPLAVGHGDYVVRNMFVDDRERITVFDPMPRWQVPRYEDICRFLVGMRLLGLQLHSHGIAYARRSLDDRERWFLSGYFGGDDIPHVRIRSYQLLVLLDKWSALVDGPATAQGWGGRLRTASLWPAHAYIGGEARRLLALLHTAEESPAG